LLVDDNLLGRWTSEEVFVALDASQMSAIQMNLVEVLGAGVAGSWSLGSAAGRVEVTESLFMEFTDTVHPGYKLYFHAHEGFSGERIHGALDTFGTTPVGIDSLFHFSETFVTFVRHNGA
jgi:hypothetical protein